MITDRKRLRRYLPYLALLLAVPALYLGVDALFEETPPTGHVYVLEGKIYTHATQEGVDAHLEALWDAYCRQREALMQSRPRSPDKGRSGCLEPEELKEILDGITRSILTNTDEFPVDMPNSKRGAYLRAYASCLRAKLINDGLEFMKDIRAANPAYLGADPSGYYDDRNGGELCLFQRNGKYQVYVGAGRGRNYNSDELDFVGTLKDGLIVAEPIPDQPDRHPKLLLDNGMVCLFDAGDRLDATYVRVGSLTEAGKALAGSAPLGNEITDDDGADRYYKFRNNGVIFFRKLPPDWPSPYQEAMAMIGMKPEEDSDR